MSDSSQHTRSTLASRPNISGFRGVDDDRPEKEIMKLKLLRLEHTAENAAAVYNLLRNSPTYCINVSGEVAGHHDGCCQNLCVNSVSGPGKALFQVIG
jgi:hypothetical protein